MDNRGILLYAVMAHKPGWSKPRFVWDGELLKRLFIYHRKLAAVRRAKQMSDDKQPGGKKLFVVGYTDTSHNTPKLVEVDWIVCEVWCEMTGKTARVNLGSRGSNKGQVTRDSRNPNKHRPSEK